MARSMRSSFAWTSPEPDDWFAAPPPLLDPSQHVNVPNSSFDTSPPHSDPSRAVEEPRCTYTHLSLKYTFDDLSEKNPPAGTATRQVRRSSKNGSLGRDWSKLVDQSTPAHGGAPGTSTLMLDT
ncbi:hypothetical protein EV363DRAFT_1404006 [Boletus edulis]|nr:hypothetical protein EV363DRAFT_1404006 [Boletus edulis]